MDNRNDEGFHYTYSAKEQEELKSIRKKYEQSSDNAESNIERLRRLDASVTKKGTAISIVLGIIGALLLGIGMSLSMTTLGATLGLEFKLTLVIGSAVGVVGIVMVILAYPVYSSITAKERKKIAPEIIRITDELMK